MWVLIELGVLLYELWLRFRYRDLDALEVRALRARKAFRDGKPRTAYRYLQENNYSLVVVRFLYDLIRNYQTERLAAKPLKLLQEYEFYTIKRLERTRILVRIGPMLGLMGTLIPLAPALVGLASGDVAVLSENLVTAFSVTVIGLLIGGLAFLVSIVRDRLYSQDISDMEYLLELLEGYGCPASLRAPALQDRRSGTAKNPSSTRSTEEDAERTVIATLPETPGRAAAPGGRLAGRRRRSGAAEAKRPRPATSAETTASGRRRRGRRPHVRRPQHGLEPRGRPVRQSRPRRPRRHGRSEASGRRRSLASSLSDHAVNDDHSKLQNLGTVMGAPENGLTLHAPAEDRYRRPQR